VKRLFDIIFSSIGLILLFPVFVIVTILIKIDNRGPIFFIQKRVGRNFKVFNIYKFRTMIMKTSYQGLPITVGNDSRITKIGKFLRKTKLDELPQIFNVIRGDMSFVGPRSEVEKYVNLYREEYREILKLRPGITDIASLTYSNESKILDGKNNPEEYYTNVILPHKIKFAKEYIKKSSFLFDLKLILLTIYKITIKNQ